MALNPVASILPQAGEVLDVKVAGEAAYTLCHPNMTENQVVEDPRVTGHAAQAQESDEYVDGHILAYHKPAPDAHHEGSTSEDGELVMPAKPRLF